MWLHDPLRIIFGIVVVVVIASLVYAPLRVLWRLRTGDIESAGSDGQSMTGKTDRP
jgi:hypothetical protein